MHFEQQMQLNNASYLFYLLFIQQVRNPLVDIAINLAIAQTNVIVVFLDFHSTKQGQPLADSWSRGLD